MGTHTKFWGNLTTQFWGRGGKFEILTPITTPNLDRGPQKIFSLGYPTPTSVPNFGLLRQGVGQGEFFENSQICELELEDQNRARSPGKLVIDIDLVLVPYCSQMVRNRSAVFIFRYLPPTRQGAPPNLTQFPVSADFAISSSPPRGLPPPKWPLHIIGLGTVVKTNFRPGCTLAPIFSKLPRQISEFFRPSTDAPSSGMLKIWGKSDERNSRNVPQPSTLLFRPTFRARVQPRSDCHRSDCPRSDCPRSTQTTQSV